MIATPTVTRAVVLVAGILGAALAVAQDRDIAAGTRQLIADLTAPGMDRGVRENDGLRELRTSAGTALAVAGGGDREFRTDSIIVKFRPGTSPGAERAMLSMVDGSATPPLPFAAFDIVALQSADPDPEAAAARLSAQPDVEFAQARYRLRPSFVPNDPLYPRQWSYPAIDMERAWDINFSGTFKEPICYCTWSILPRSTLTPIRLRMPRPSPWNSRNTMRPCIANPAG